MRTGTIYAVRRVLNGSTFEDRLVTINLATGVATPVGVGTGVIKVAGVNTDIRGMGFDVDGNLEALTNNGTTAQIIALSAANLTGVNANPMTVRTRSRSPGARQLATSTPCALGRDGAPNTPTYAYDTNALAASSSSARASRPTLWGGST